MPAIIGHTLLDQFRVDEFIDSGGMGAVYRVWDLKRNVPLAMKVLHSGLAEDPVVFKRFQREANALKKLAHPNIVPFYGLYQTRDFAFLLERFIDGPALSDILRQSLGRPLPMNVTLVYLKALCAALGYAHANQVVHCDVKPGNVMVDRGGNIYLTDFGIARHADSTTTTMGVAGTPAYMAPEQIRGEPVSPATDVYALGVMLFEMLTGQRPFRGEETGTEKGGSTASERIRYGHLHLAPPDPRSLNPNLPVGLSNVILQSLSKRPDARFTSTQALLTAACAAAGVSPAAVAERTAVKDLPVRREYTSGKVIVPGPARPVGGAPLPTRNKRGSRTAGVIVIICVFMCMLAGGVYAMARPKIVFVPTAPPSQPRVKTIPPAEPVVPVNNPPPAEPAVPIAPDPPTEIPTKTATRPPTDTPTATRKPPMDTPTVTRKPPPTVIFCSGAPASRVKLDDYVEVTTTDGSGLYLRLAPETKPVKGATPLMQPPEQLWVNGGPRCLNGAVFWHVSRLSTGQEGWVMEGDNTLYYIKPIVR